MRRNCLRINYLWVHSVDPRERIWVLAQLAACPAPASPRSGRAGRGRTHAVNWATKVGWSTVIGLLSGKRRHDGELKTAALAKKVFATA